MTIVIDSDFSVYNLVERIRQTSTLVNHRRTMSLISFEIEDATLQQDASGRVFSGFQKMSKFIPQLRRYTELAQTAEHVFVFGVVDTELPPIDNITYVIVHKLRFF